MMDDDPIAVFLSGTVEAALAGPFIPAQNGLAIDGFAADLGGVIRCVVARRQGDGSAAARRRRTQKKVGMHPRPV